jgi:hypothetical protein
MAADFVRIINRRKTTPSTSRAGCAQSFEVQSLKGTGDAGRADIA